MKFSLPTTALILFLSALHGCADAVAGGSASGVGGGGDALAIQVSALLAPTWDSYLTGYSVEEGDLMPFEAASRVLELVVTSGAHGLRVTTEDRLYLLEYPGTTQWRKITETEFLNHHDPKTTVREVDAINDPTAKLLFIGRIHWQAASPIDRLALSFHELLGLAELNEGSLYPHTRHYLNWLSRNPALQSRLLELAADGKQPELPISIGEISPSRALFLGLKPAEKVKILKNGEGYTAVDLLPESLPKKANERLSHIYMGLANAEKIRESEFFSEKLLVRNGAFTNGGVFEAYMKAGEVYAYGAIFSASVVQVDSHRCSRDSEGELKYDTCPQGGTLVYRYLSPDLINAWNDDQEPQLSIAEFNEKTFIFKVIPSTFSVNIFAVER